MVAKLLGTICYNEHTSSNIKRSLLTSSLFQGIAQFWFDLWSLTWSGNRIAEGLSFPYIDILNWGPALGDPVFWGDVLATKHKHFFFCSGTWTMLTVLLLDK